MRILITEDDDDKALEFSSFIASATQRPVEVIRARDMTEFLSCYDDEIDICLIDLRLPAYGGAEANTNGIGILKAINQRGRGNIRLIAISSFPDEFEDVREEFEKSGCILLDYGNKEVWKSALRALMIQCHKYERLDFLIITALRTERAPYTDIKSLNGVSVSRDGVNRYDVSIGGKIGTILDLPRMGLVDAAASAGVWIERYRPAIVVMSGICAGFDGRVTLGQLLVGELAYEYQSGKWTTDGFSQEPYQVPIDEKIRALAAEIVGTDGLLSELELGWRGSRPSEMAEPKLATFTSGSAVIADEQFIEQVATHHRRVAGLDMEAFAIYRAAHLSRVRPMFLCAKTVVDLAGSGKDDKLQPYGCHVSARFAVKFLESYFSQTDTTE